MELWTHVNFIKTDILNKKNINDFYVIPQYKTADILHLNNLQNNNNNNNNKISKKNKKIKKLKQNTITVELSEYIDDMLSSYNYKYEDVLKQCWIDVPRMNIYYNSKKIDTDIDINKFINGLVENRKYFLILLCTQANIGMLFEKLYNIFSKENIHLGERNDSDSKLLLSIREDKILIKKKLRIFKIDEHGISLKKN